MGYGELPAAMRRRLSVVFFAHVGRIGLLCSMGENNSRETVFRFRRFEVRNALSAMKVGTDGVLLGAWTPLGSDAGDIRVLDAGSGTGLIALMLAQRGARHIDAADVDASAVEEARANVASSPWPDAVNVMLADVTAMTAGDYDMVVSNPPFYTEDVRSPRGERALARHGSGFNPLTLIRQCGSTALLRPRGSLCMITPASLADDVEMEAALRCMHVAQAVRVYTKPTACEPRRVLWHIVKGNACGAGCSADRLTIGSERYRALTGDFYL